jgi:4-carboxymuconolactone decarboxylase
MRLPLIAPADLTSEQRPLYDDMREGIAKTFKGFTAMRDDGTLLGPWNPWLHEPAFGKASWDLVRALADKPSLPKPVREVAILVTGAHFNSAYELYAMCSSASSAACLTKSFRPSSPDSAPSI